jgi:hypothetical protein
VQNNFTAEYATAAQLTMALTVIMPLSALT